MVAAEDQYEGENSAQQEWEIGEGFVKKGIFAKCASPTLCVCQGAMGHT